VPVTFTPTSGPYAKQRCGGVNLIVTERNILDSPEMGIELAAALHILYPNDWKLDKMITILANHAAFNALVAGEDPRNIAEGWREDVEKFIAVRAKYLIYK